MPPKLYMRIRGRSCSGQCYVGPSAWQLVMVQVLSCLRDTWRKWDLRRATIVHLVFLSNISQQIACISYNWPFWSSATLIEDANQRGLVNNWWLAILDVRYQISIADSSTRLKWRSSAGPGKSGISISLQWYDDCENCRLISSALVIILSRKNFFNNKSFGLNILAFLGSLQSQSSYAKIRHSHFGFYT